MRSHTAITALGLSVVLIAGCQTDKAPGNADGVAAATAPDTASDAGAKVARRIVSGTLDDAIGATREALTRGGITLTDFAGTVQAPMGAPSPYFVLPAEAVLLAYEARRQATDSRLTLGEMGSMLADFGWPFAGQGMPGQQLMAIVAAWVKNAQAAPTDPTSFTPLFLAHMGRRQVPAVDLASDSTDPGAVRLGFLEYQLIAAALTRGLGDSLPSTKPKRTGMLNGAAVTTVSYGSTAAAGPCDDAKKWFGETIPGGLVGAYGGWGVGQSLEKALQDAGLSEGKAGQVSKALDAVGIGMKIIKLGQLYGSAQIELDYASEVPAHRPEPRGEKLVSVVARAGVDPEDWKKYQEALRSSELAGSVRSCLETYGLPSWSDLADVAGGAEGWQVRWVLGRGTPKHALHTTSHNEWAYLGMGSRRMDLKRTSETSAEAKYTFMLAAEPEAGHPGDELKAQVGVTAELLTAEPPGVGTLADAMQGIMGLVKALADLGIGWFQTVVTPEADLIVPVLYHEPGIDILVEDQNQVALTLSAGPNEFAAQPGNRAGGSSAWLRASGSERTRHVYAGTIRLGEDSLWHGQVRLSSLGHYTQPDVKAIEKLPALSETETDFARGMTALMERFKFMSNMPSCGGSYEGLQLLAVEGSFVTDQNGKRQVELAFIPVGPPEQFTSTRECPVDVTMVDGIPVVPNRLVREGQRTSVKIDPPVAGERRIYRLPPVSMPGVWGSTVITVADN